MIRRLIVLNLLVAAAWIVGGALGSGLAGNGHLVLLWPPSGIALGALLIGGARLFPGVLLGPILAGFLHPVPLGARLALVVGYTGSAALGAWLLRRVVPLDLRLRRTRDVLRLVAFGVALPSMLAGACIMLALGPLSTSHGPPSSGMFYAWWMSNAVGGLLFTPLVLAWSQPDVAVSGRDLRGWRVTILLGLLVLSLLGALAPEALGDSTVQILALPLLVCAALTCNLRTAFSAAVVLVFSAVAGHAVGADSLSDPLHATEMWIFSTSASLSVLVAGTLATSERAAQIESKARDRLRQLMDDTPSMLWVGDTDGSCTFVNRTYSEFLGVDEEATRGFGWLDFVHPDDQSAMAGLPARILAANGPVEAEARKRAADGSWRWFAMRAKPLVGPDGDVAGIVSTCIDIDDRHLAERDLQRRTDQLLAVNDALTRVLERSDWSGAAGVLLETLLVQTRSEAGFLAKLGPAGLTLLAARGLPDAFETIPLHDLPAHLRRVLQDGCVVATRATSQPPPDAGPLASLAPALMLPCLAQDDVTGLCVVTGRPGGYDEAEAEDVRLLVSAASVLVQHKRQRRRERELEQQLAHRERLASIGTLAAGVAHEINNPVGAILLSVQAARRALHEDPLQAQACIERIEQDARRCARITRGILRFARQERGDRQARDLVPTIHAAIDFVSSFAERSRCALVVSLPESLPDVVCNGHAIEQVLVNLVQNAIQAGSRRVDIYAASDAESVTLTLIDDGEGLAPDIGDRIFDPFFTTRQDEGGTGLGLSLSHGIVTDHGGALAVSARGDGGTRAVIVLPRVTAEFDTESSPPMDSAKLG